MRIGVLAVQGAFAEHIAALKRLGADAFEIRQLQDISQDFDGLKQKSKPVCPFSEHVRE